MNTFGCILFIFFLIQLSSCQDDPGDVGKCVDREKPDNCDGVKEICGKACKTQCDEDESVKENRESCKIACDISVDELCKCLNDNQGCCKRPNRAGRSAHISCSVVDGSLNGAGLVRAGPNCPDNCEAGEKNCTCNPDNIPSARKKRASEKDDDPLFLKFNPLFIWDQDSKLSDKLIESKKRKCCVTTKRVVPFTWNIKKNIWPVYCPIDGGYQWIDQVKCNIKSKSDMAKYSVTAFSKNKKQCKQKECQKHCTMRTYLVTNVKPAGFWGHCFYYFLPVWYRDVTVDTHCVCPINSQSPTGCK